MKLHRWTEYGKKFRELRFCQQIVDYWLPHLVPQYSLCQSPLFCSTLWKNHWPSLCLHDHRLWKGHGYSLAVISVSQQHQKYYIVKDSLNAFDFKFQLWLKCGPSLSSSQLCVMVTTLIDNYIQDIHHRHSSDLKPHWWSTVTDGDTLGEK